MRIVAGKLKGRVIAAPAGEGTRPTTDRVREALFSSLYSLRGDLAGAVVLDAFAGSGALGIEAISRGAQSALFCERDAKAVAVLKRNLDVCGLGSPQVEVLRCDVLRTPLGNRAQAFDLLFLDPPYAYDAALVLGSVRALANAGMLADEALIVYEHGVEYASDVAKAAEEAALVCLTVKKYGKTGVTILGSPTRPSRRERSGT